MKKSRFRLLILCVFLVFMNIGKLFSYASILTSYEEGGLLSGTPDYDWWYGCSPTSAGMIMGYYDIHGYGGLTYDNLVPSGVAELNTFGNPPPGGFLVNNIIASQGHIADFYSGGYGASGDDNYTGRTFNCLADFMGTSQDAENNSNGSTRFWSYVNGAPLYVADIYAAGEDFYSSSGLFGMWEYFNYAGYGSGDPSTDYNFFNQPIDALGLTYGFTFKDYMEEIDIGRVVMIGIEGHSMLGYGYDEATRKVYFHDTWNPGQDSMEWGGYYLGSNMLRVTCFTPTGGDVPIPEPLTLFLFAISLIGIAGFNHFRVKFPAACCEK